MRVNDATHAGEGFVELDMRIYVGRRLEIAFHDVRIEIRHDHVGGRQPVKRHAAGLDHHQPALGVVSTGVAERVQH